MKTALRDLVIAVLVLVCIIAAVLNRSANQPKAEPALYVAESHAEMTDAFGATFGYIKGTVRNDSTRSYGLVVVNFNLYDKDGAQVGSASAHGYNIQPDSTWKFSALVGKQGTASYRLIGIEETN